MGQILHATSRTMEAIRREIHNREESLAKAATRFNVNPKTIITWRKREDSKEFPMGPKKVKSPGLSEAEERGHSGIQKDDRITLRGCFV